MADNQKLIIVCVRKRMIMNQQMLAIVWGNFAMYASLQAATD